MFSNFFKASKNTITVDELATLYPTETNSAFVDVREDHEWDNGHIEWFTHIPLSGLSDHIQDLRKFERVFFICRSGGRSGTACNILLSAGLDTGYNVRGGMNAWESGGYPMVT